MVFYINYFKNGVKHWNFNLNDTREKEYLPCCFNTLMPKLFENLTFDTILIHLAQQAKDTPILKVQLKWFSLEIVLQSELKTFFQPWMNFALISIKRLKFRRCNNINLPFLLLLEDTLLLIVYWHSILISGLNNFGMSKFLG